MTRREARELAFILFFEKTFTEEPVSEILQRAGEARDVEGDAFALSLAQGAESRTESIDQRIAACSLKWSKDRISRVALAIMPRCSITSGSFRTSTRNCAASVTRR